MFSPINPSRTTRGRCVHRRVVGEGFCPDRRMSPSVTQRKFVVDEFIAVATALCRRVFRNLNPRADRAARLQRYEHPQTAGTNLEFHWAVADQLPIDLDRHDLLAA